MSDSPEHRIVVVGGVAGGMSCAARARRLDERAEITVLERGEHVSFANCGLPYHVGGEIDDAAALLVQTPQSLRAALDLDVRTGHDVVALDARAKTVTVRTASGTHELPYDTLVLSPGARAVRPAIRGLDSPRVRTLRTVDDAITLRERVDDGARRAVVLGAGFIGVEAAEALAGRGLEVELVDVAPHVLPALDPELAHLVAAELGRIGVRTRPGTAATEIVPREGGDEVLLADGTVLEADLIVLSAGVRPDTETFEAAGVVCERGAVVTDEHGRTNLPDVWAVGDAVASTDAVTGLRRPVALAGPANRAGRLVADAIVRGPDASRPIPAPLGTTVVRVGDLTAATTGASRRAVAEAGIAVHTLHLHPLHHAGYFPGAEPLHLVVHVRAGDGLLLGAQAVGSSGVDKRIDVLATALRNHATVADLIDLDLAYAPPYGQAKDPVNLAGLVGSNVLDGTLRLWYADELEDTLRTSLVLDVRSEAEFASGHLPGSVNVPHTDLRERISEVRSAAGGRPVRTLCGSGVRSHLAHRILAQAGLDSASLSGGMLTLRATLAATADQILTTDDPLARAS
ncbi:NADPH-dependent 2,4-dienoyl-CoA reductase/sulfur reductase-like enzyme [Mumia flava]|uniref:NADPH-dependent 2,4-dienoyl-CoA reductase/sulfur reductase-like enzyme n=1 Tax=Mumia flava TaxID=1348852 RepID=A0A0B2B2H1_9ACTN|nr:FAD-dependent oxidoreductase [Mumia flava]PJJ57636.1 NADPH-dependent 2,4-dienoyl-CoA reductase/sulfur reductase-like enzyme [Mumia flava]